MSDEPQKKPKRQNLSLYPVTYKKFKKSAEADGRLYEPHLNILIDFYQKHKGNV